MKRRGAAANGNATRSNRGRTPPGVLLAFEPAGASRVSDQEESGDMSLVVVRCRICLVTPIIRREGVANPGVCLFLWCLADFDRSRDRAARVSRLAS